MTGKILIVGGTGLVGGLLTAELIRRGLDKKLHLLLRRPNRDDLGAVTKHIQLQENWPKTIAKIKPKTVISCLGTTIKKAGSQQAFAEVDRDLVASVAKAAKKAGARHFLSVSSTMADSSASNFYLKTKGEAEDALRSEKFDRLDIIRPGLLRGNRTNDSRLGESLAIIASPVMDMLLHGKFRRYRSIHAEDVAAAMANLLGQSEGGEHIHENDQILSLK